MIHYYLIKTVIIWEIIRNKTLKMILQLSKKMNLPVSWSINNCFRSSLKFIAVYLLSVEFNQLSDCVNQDRFSWYKSILSMSSMLSMSNVFLIKSYQKREHKQIRKLSAMTILFLCLFSSWLQLSIPRKFWAINYKHRSQQKLHNNSACTDPQQWCLDWKLTKWAWV